MSTRRSTLAAGVAVLGAALALPTPAPARVRPAAPPPAVVAVLEAGVNVLHEDFAFGPGQRPVLPRGLPPAARIPMP
ncbi:MAG: hypothetical protein M3217_03675, partial [Actinomycetota bacterium]|nr:hypothetical protein [Actinomycetota bacterium]